MVWFAGSRGEAVRCAGAIQARKWAGATNRAQIRHTRPHTRPHTCPTTKPTGFLRRTGPLLGVGTTLVRKRKLSDLQWWVRGGECVPREGRPVVQRLRWVWAGAASRKKKRDGGVCRAQFGVALGTTAATRAQGFPGTPSTPDAGIRSGFIARAAGGVARAAVGGLAPLSTQGWFVCPHRVGQGAFFVLPLPNHSVRPCFSFLVRPFPQKRKVCPCLPIQFISSVAPALAAPPHLCVENLACVQCASRRWGCCIGGWLTVAELSTRRAQGAVPLSAQADFTHFSPRPRPRPRPQPPQ